MPKLKKDQLSNYTTPYGKKVIAINVSRDLEKRILDRAKSLDLTRQSYIITLINVDLEKQKGA